MSEVKVIREDGVLNIRCGKICLDGHLLWIGNDDCNHFQSEDVYHYLIGPQLDDLYTVLQAWEQAKQWKKCEDYLDKIDKLKDVFYTHDVKEFDLPKKYETCKHYDKDNYGRGGKRYCQKLDVFIYSDFFCKYYERKEES